MPVEIQKNREYVLRFRARADASRSMAGAVGQTFSPWQTIGLYHQVVLTDEWQDYEMSFRAEADEPHARVFFDLGASAVSVDMAEVTLHHQSDFLLTHLNGSNPFASVNPVKQGRNEPGQKIEPDLTDKYYLAYLFNAMGCRGRDYPIPRSPEGTRILVLGDSLALGAGVHQADTLASQLEGLLNSGPPGVDALPEYEVINCGVGGYGTHDAVKLYETLLVTYEPDVVLLVMTPDDDQSWIEEREQEAFNRLENPGHQFLAWTSHQENLFDRVVPDYSRSLAWVTRLEQLVQANGGKVGVVVFRYSTHRAWESLIQQLSQSVQGGTMPVLDLGKSLLAHRSENELFVTDDDKHPNEVAHRLAAQGIRNFLINNGLVKKESMVSLDIRL